MKFKVEPKDFFLFCLYSIFLLYLCCIAVLNFASLSNDGTFYGLLPFKAFTMPYLPVTLGMFFVALIIIFTSVSSYIFNKEKGSGFGLTFGEKKESGYSRWAKDKEIKNGTDVVKVNISDPVAKAAGIPLINNGKEVWVDNGEYHSLVIGSTGSGKSQTVVNPLVNLLAKKGESMIITDPKGELYRYCSGALKKRGYKIVLLNFRDPLNGNAWNPLNLPYQYYKKGNTDKATELLDDVALNILYDPSSGNDSDFWEKSAADYFSGLALGLFMDAKEKEVNLNSINLMSTVGEERYATSNYVKEYFGLKGEQSNAYVFASNTINAPNETKGGILSTFRQKIRLFSSREELSEMLSYSDFDMRQVGKEKTAVFLIIHDEKKTYHSLLTIFIKQIYETLIDVAQENGGKLQYRTNFILDEFQNMPPLKDVDSMVAAARSRDIRFTFIIQNFAGLNDVYGKEVAEVIKGNCGNIIYLISTEMAALEEISKMCGEVKSKEKDKTASTPLVTVTDLQKMKLFEVIIKRLRTDPFKTQFVPDFKIDWGLEKAPAEFPKRVRQPIELFDLKKYVTEEKKKRMMENFDKNKDGMGFNPGMPSPFGGMGGGMPSPFGGAPFGGANPFGGGQPNPNPNPFGGPSPLSNMDIDAMMKDIDQKLKELDEEEARQKELLDKKNSEVKIDLEITKPIDKPFNIFEEESKQDVIVENKKEEIETPKEVEKDDSKPVVNIDADSIIVNENVITDDEFFDDFFGDD